MTKGNDENTAELARLKGQMNAIEEASVKKRCGITFQHAPPPVSSGSSKQQRGSLASLNVGVRERVQLADVHARLLETNKENTMKMKIAILAACAGAVVFAATTCADAETTRSMATDTIHKQTTVEKENHSSKANRDALKN